MASLFLHYVYYCLRRFWKFNDSDISVLFNFVFWILNITIILFVNIISKYKNNLSKVFNIFKVLEIIPELPELIYEHLSLKYFIFHQFYTFNQELTDTCLKGDKGIIYTSLIYVW